MDSVVNLRAGWLELRRMSFDALLAEVLVMLRVCPLYW